MLFDNARALVDHHDAATREVLFNSRLKAFARYWDFVPRACAPIAPSDANLSFTPAGAHWAISLYGENLSNEATWGGDTVLPSTPAFGYSGAARPTFSPLNKGRVIGLELRVRR